MSERPVILVSEVGGGTSIVRWYADIWSAERNHPVLSASGSGVSIHTRYLHEVPGGWVDMAREVYTILRRSPHVDVSSYATHKHSVVSNGPLVLVASDG